MTDTPPLVLPLSSRDAQWLVGITALASAVLYWQRSGDIDSLLKNTEAVSRMLAECYSPVEANTLSERIYAFADTKSMEIIRVDVLDPAISVLLPSNGLVQ